MPRLLQPRRICYQFSLSRFVAIEFEDVGDNVNVLLARERSARAERHLSAGDVVEVINSLVAAAPFGREAVSGQWGRRRAFEPLAVAGGAALVVQRLPPGSLSIGVDSARLLRRLLS